MSEQEIAEEVPQVEPGFGADASPEVEAEPVKAEAEPEEVEATEESEAESPPAEDEDLEEKTSPYQERIDKLTARFRETERTLTAMERENMELRKQIDEIPLPQEEVKTLKDFDYNEAEFQTYIFQQAEKRAETAAERAVRGFTAKTEAETAEAQFASAEKEFATSVSDYQETVYNPDLRISAPMAEAVRHSEIGPELIYHLGKNPDVARKIAGMSPAGAGVELGRLEVKLQAEKAKAKGKTVSDAPPPPKKKLGGGSQGSRVTSTDPASDKLSDEEWFKLEEKRQAKLRG